jgi:hypothetical protein
MPLPVPTRIQNLGPGTETSLVQMIITWAQRQERPILQTYATGPSDPQIPDLTRRLYGLTAGLLCAAAKGRGGLNLTAALKTEAIESLRKRLEDALSRQPIYDQGMVVERERGVRGRAAEILCPDHIDVGLHCPFYYTDSDGYRNLRDLRGFTQLTNRVFDRLIPHYNQRNFDQDFKNAVGALAFELVSNTEDHAKTDLAGKDLAISFRGLHARHFQAAPTSYLTSVAGFSPFEDYFRDLLGTSRSVRNIIELSVFDSGPGMAQRWLGRPLADFSTEQELHAVRECFLEGTSSKLHKMYGGGLPLVLKLLKRHHGFIRLRTGRLSLYLAANEDFLPERPDLNAWVAPNATALAPVSGTLVSLLVPVPERAI